VFSALEVFYENALYKFTFDIDIDIKGENGGEGRGEGGKGKKERRGKVPLTMNSWLRLWVRVRDFSHVLVTEEGRLYRTAGYVVMLTMLHGSFV